MCTCNCDRTRIMDTVNACIKSKKEQAFIDGRYYDTLIKQFEERKGIFQPVRAVYKNYEDKYIDDIVKDATINATFELSQLSEVPEESRMQFIKSFVHRSVVIGYFSAWVEKSTEDNTKYVVISYSVCRPIDYPMFAKWESKMNCLVRSDVLIVEPSMLHELNPDLMELSFKNRKWLFDNNHAYYFPITIKNQFEYFIRRCQRYFCEKEVKQEEPKKVIKKSSAKKGKKK